MTCHFEKKVNTIKQSFCNLPSPDEIYQAIISFGKKSLPFPNEHKTEENRILQCQSSTYILSSYENGKMFFQTTSDALISHGLSSLLCFVYNEETPASILKNPPVFLKEIGIDQSLSPSRSNGLYHMYVRIQKDALKFLAEEKKNNLSM